MKAGYTTAERILNIKAIKTLSVKIMIKLDIAKPYGVGPIYVIK